MYIDQKLNPQHVYIFEFAPLNLPNLPLWSLLFDLIFSRQGRNFSANYFR